jgi:hypothetical protein
MNICLDTSALNALCDDPDSADLVLAIRSSHRVLLGSLNVMEVVATSGESRRRLLLEFMKSLSDGTLPLAMPNKLVRRAAHAFSKGKKALTGTITPEEGPSWWFINNPSLADAEAQREAFKWKQSIEDPFRDIHRSARDEFQGILASNPGLMPRSPGHSIKMFKENSEALYAIVKDVFKRETRQHLSRDAMWQLFYRAPQWPLFLAGWAHESFERALQSSNYSPKGKPGALDLWHAVYLPMCDIFVTRDVGQHRALRLLNVLSRRLTDRPTPKTKVLMYHAFRRLLTAD